MAKGRPGILLYFETVEPLLTQLNDEQAGRLFRAAFDYALRGVTPSFSDVLVTMAWAVLKPCIDRDEDRYNDTVIQRQYAVYCRECKKNGKSALPFEAYKAISTDNGSYRPITDNNERHRPIANDNTRYQPYPTTTTNTTTNANPTTTYRGACHTSDEMTQVAECDEAAFENVPEVYDHLADDNPYVVEALSEIEEDNDLPF